MAVAAIGLPQVCGADASLLKMHIKTPYIAYIY